MNQQVLISVLVLISSAGFLRAQDMIQQLPGEKKTYVLIETVEINKRLTYEVLETAEFKTRCETLKKDAALFPKALALAEKEWKTDNTVKGNPFPKAMLAPVKTTAKGTFDSREKADQKLEAINDDIAKQEKAREEREKKKKAKDKTTGKTHKSDKMTPEDLLRIAADIISAKLTELQAAEQEKPAANAANAQ